MSKPHVHELAGLKPDALATYLAALGIFRLLAEQKDSTARGFWLEEHFFLVTDLDRESLAKFFLEEYKPTPILAPWNGGGGFLDVQDDAPDTQTRIDRLMSFRSPRFHALQQAVERARAVISPELPAARRERDRLTEELRAQRGALKSIEPGGEQHKRAMERFRQLEQLRQCARDRVESVKEDVKAGLLRKISAEWDGTALEWFNASVILDEVGKPAYPWHLGTGGNEGNRDYTAAFQDNLCLLIEPDGTPSPTAARRLNALLHGTPAAVLQPQSVGHFAPGRAGGVNMASALEGDSGINPWEFVFMLEGSVALVAGITRRGDVGRGSVSSPFWVKGAAAGFASASDREDSPRGEQWLPLWSRALRYDELVELIREGRAQVRHGNVTRAGDLLRATARLGLARGIDSLQRFAYLKRNGDSTLAVSAGRFRVASRPHQALLDEVAPWIDLLIWHARRTKDNNVPLSLAVIATRAQEALFAICRREATPAEWRELLIALGAAEFALLRSGKNPARRPLPRLSPHWISAVDDRSEHGRTTLRLALSLASQHVPSERDGSTLKGSVRCHFLPLVDPDTERPHDEGGRAESNPECVCVGRNLVADAIALVRRRSIWVRTAGGARRERVPRLPLRAVQSCEASSGEIAWWLRHDQFDDEILKLARPLLALDWDKVARQPVLLPVLCRALPDPLHLLFRLTHLPFDIPVRESNGQAEIGITVRLDPEPLRRLASGDLDGALQVVVRRLSASGLQPVFRRGIGAPGLARRLAASLAFPISQREATSAAALVCKPYEAKDTEEQAVIST